MVLDLENPVHVIVILVFVAPALLGLRLLLQWWSVNYWIRRFRVKAGDAGCRDWFERELNHLIDLTRGSREGLSAGEIRGAFEAACQHTALFPADADRQLTSDPKGAKQ